MKVLIEIDDQTLSKIEKEAEREKRSRKATIEKVILDYFT